MIGILDHTADIGVRIRADSPGAAFTAAAEAMFDFMVDREQVEAVERWKVSIEADGWEDLLVAWLEELLYRYETERLVMRACSIAEIDTRYLVAEIEGERLDRERHETKLQIKAVTYHQLRAGEMDGGFDVQVIFDI